MRFHAAMQARTQPDAQDAPQVFVNRVAVSGCSKKLPPLLLQRFPPKLLLKSAKVELKNYLETIGLVLEGLSVIARRPNPLHS